MRCLPPCCPGNEMKRRLLIEIKWWSCRHGIPWYVQYIHLSLTPFIRPRSTTICTQRMPWLHDDRVDLIIQRSHHYVAQTKLNFMCCCLQDRIEIRLTIDHYLYCNVYYLIEFTWSPLDQREFVISPLQQVTKQFTWIILMIFSYDLHDLQSNTKIGNDFWVEYDVGQVVDHSRKDHQSYNRVMLFIRTRWEDGEVLNISIRDVVLISRYFGLWLLSNIIIQNSNLLVREDVRRRIKWNKYN